MQMNDPLVIAGKSYRSRLIVGTGKYKDLDETRDALAASGAEIVTVALRRIDLKPGQPSLLDAIDPRSTSCCPTPPAATPPTRRSAPLHLARELGMDRPRQARGDRRSQAHAVPRRRGDAGGGAPVLVKDGFVVLPYSNDDPIMAASSRTSAARR